LYASPYLVRMIKSTRVRWAVRTARMGRRDVHTKFWPENLNVRDHFGDTGLHRKIILEWIFGKRGWVVVN